MPDRLVILSDTAKQVMELYFSRAGDSNRPDVVPEDLATGEKELCAAGIIEPFGKPDGTGRQSYQLSRAGRALLRGRERNGR